MWQDVIFLVWSSISHLASTIKIFIYIVDYRNILKFCFVSNTSRSLICNTLFLVFPSDCCDSPTSVVHYCNKCARYGNSAYMVTISNKVPAERNCLFNFAVQRSRLSVWRGPNFFRGHATDCAGENPKSRTQQLRAPIFHSPKYLFLPYSQPYEGDRNIHLKYLKTSYKPYSTHQDLTLPRPNPKSARSRNFGRGEKFECHGLSRVACPLDGRPTPYLTLEIAAIGVIGTILSLQNNQTPISP